MAAERVDFITVLGCRINLDVQIVKNMGCIAFTQAGRGRAGLLASIYLLQNWPKRLASPPRLAAAELFSERQIPPVPRPLPPPAPPNP